MSEERITRRLAAILAADVVGYSRLMGRDEQGTLARLKAHRSERLDPVIGRHRGRLVKLTGDGALVEFSSAVDALNAAIEIQEAMAEANLELREDTRIVFRIGLHLGDLIVEGDDLYGDGVNVAARLEAEAPAGGIVISANFHDAVFGRLDASFVELGALALKNIERPVRAYRVQRPGETAASTPAPVTGPPPTLPDKPSIAVLPFQNMSGDPEQEYFADGVVDDIILALSRVKSLFVVSRTSSFTYKGKGADVRKIAQELGVRYLLEGSVRKAGSKLRLTGQLVEAATGTHVWAERFEGEAGDMFDLQDRITSGVVVAMLPTLVQAEIERSRRKPTENLVAYDYFLRGRAKYQKYTNDSNDEAVALFRKAAELDPEWALPVASIAECFKRRIEWGWSSDTSRDLSEAAALAHKAMAIGTSEPQALALAGSALMLTFPEESAGLLEQAVSLDPNNFSAWNWRGWTALVLGEEDAGHYFEKALRLSPTFPGRYWMHVGLSTTYLLSERCAEAAALVGTVLRQHPHLHIALWVHSASLALAGQVGEAVEVCKTLTKVVPAMRLSNLRNWIPTRDERAIALISKGLRLAGLPE
ncbi:adenylate/guanylate cyclase domain-containing protein [Reyranella sp.]|uniref:adenylate/guanylate cyclase domain-containing protein n=1 Tax=Reyranella sp. TaxID=1929291 RepID=UPI003D0E6E4E